MVVFRLGPDEYLGITFGFSTSEKFSLLKMFIVDIARITAAIAKIAHPSFSFAICILTQKILFQK
jgi:hypothetical protein